MNKIRKPVIQIGMIEEHDETFVGVLQSALTEEDKGKIVSELLYTALLYANQWKLDCSTIYERQREFMELEKKITKKTEERIKQGKELEKKYKKKEAQK